MSHVVPLADRDASVEDAFVETLPKKLCMCDAPGTPGCTIGSSGSECENTQLVWNTPPPGPVATNCAGDVEWARPSTRAFVDDAHALSASSATATTTAK